MPATLTKLDFRPRDQSARAEWNPRQNGGDWCRQQARAEYENWLSGYRFGGADAYKEDPEGGALANRTLTSWSDLKARGRMPEKVRDAKRRIRERWGLRNGARLT
jgi:hypothetical protein